jgi:3-dehydroquinate dehydratase type I
MNKPRICLSVIDNNPDAIRSAEVNVDLFELRLDILGDNWRNLCRILNKPWIACNRSRDEGGWGDFDTGKRIEALLEAGKGGASIIDIEYATPGLIDKVNLIKKYSQCLISFHDLESTPSLRKLIKITEEQIQSGADICKIVTTATKFEDNITLLKLISHFPGIKITAFAMGELGRTSRLFSPLCGGYFTYGCLEEGRQAASGQISISEMREIYGLLKE